MRLTDLLGSAGGAAGQEDRSWEDDAACAGLSSVVYFPEAHDILGLVAEAKKTCGGCPVRAECLQTALVNNEKWGIWGGLTPLERGAWKRAIQAGKPPPGVGVCASCGKAFLHWSKLRAALCRFCYHNPALKQQRALNLIMRKR